MAWLIILLMAVACQGRTLRVPSEYVTIQSAMDSVRDGDTVLVAMGTYAEALYAPLRSFLLMGDVPPDTGDVPRPTVDPSPLPGSDSLACLIIPFGATAQIQDMGFRNGPQMFPRIRRGGVICNATSLEVRKCTFDSTYVGIQSSFDHPCPTVVTESRFLHNPDYCIALIGGTESTLFASHCLFSGVGQVTNELVHVNGNSIISQCVFRDSASTSMLSLYAPDNAVIDRNQFISGGTDWHILEVTTYYEGGHSSGQITNNLFSDLHIGLDVMSLQTVCIETLMVGNNVFQNIHGTANTACYGCVTYGCGHGGWGAGSAILENNVFGPIAAPLPGNAEAIQLTASATVHHNTFHDMSSDTVPAVECSDGRSVLDSNNFVNTRLALCKYLPGGDSLDARNNWWGDASGPYDSLLNPAGCGAQILCNHEVLINPWLDSAYTPSTAHPTFIPHPSSLILSCFPNPFNPVTQIRYDIPTAGNVTLNVFDVLGREVVVLVDKRLNAGSHTIEWNAERYPSGMYFAVVHSGDHHAVQKMLLLK